MVAKKTAGKIDPSRYRKIVRWSDEDAAYVVEVPDLPGCMADGETEAEAVRAADEVILEWADAAHRLGREVPPPTTEATASGRFVVRISKSLHYRLQTLAQDEGVSLNQLVVSLLAAREAEKRSQR